MMSKTDNVILIHKSHRPRWINFWKWKQILQNIS